jgi:hypothetical protein
LDGQLVFVIGVIAVHVDLHLKAVASRIGLLRRRAREEDRCLEPKFHPSQSEPLVRVSSANPT